jgi:hypothetical protein
MPRQGVPAAREGKRQADAYHGGLREPHLERNAAKPDLLGQIIAPRAARPVP